MMPERNLSWQRFLNSNNYVLDPLDTISRLPEGVIHHITSFLPSEDKDQLRLLSRKWRLVSLQSQKILHLCTRRLDEQQLLTIFEDYFPSTEVFKLIKCSGIINLNVVNNKLRQVMLIKCENLENVKFIAPALEKFGFMGSNHKPCIVKFGATSNLTQLHLLGARIDETTFSDCDTTFPVLTHMTLGDSHDMPDNINISSSSLKAMYFFELKKAVNINMDAPELVYVQYRGDHPIANFVNTNLPSVMRATIELDPGANHEPNGLWFRKLVLMIQAFKPAEMLLLKVTLDKCVIIPEELRRSLSPPVRGSNHVMVELVNPLTNIVDLIDTMLWISPRATYLSIIRENKTRYLWLKHGEILDAQGHSCCASYPTRCWRHSLVEYNSDIIDENSWLDLSYYFKENLKKVGRHATQRHFWN